MSDKEKESPLDMVPTDVAVRLAAGLLSGSGVSHNDTKQVSELAVKHAYALRAEIKRAAVVENARIEAEKKQAEIDEEAAEAKAKADAHAAKEAELEHKKSEHAHRK